MSSMARTDYGFPDVRWGKSDTGIARAGQYFVSTKPGSWVVRQMVPVDRRVLKKSKSMELAPIAQCEFSLLVMRRRNLFYS